MVTKILIEVRNQMHIKLDHINEALSNENKCKMDAHVYVFIMYVCIYVRTSTHVCILLGWKC